MSAPLCTVCLDTGSKSQFAGGELDCVACNAATERAEMNRAIEQRKNELTGEYRLSTFSAEWYAYQLGKAAADVQNFSRHEVKLSNGITKIMEGDNIIGIKSDGFITNKDSGGILHEPLQHDSLKCGTTRADRDIERLVQAAFKKAAGGCIFGDASRLDSAQDWFSQGYRAAPVVPVAAQPVVPEGWKLVPEAPTPKMVDATWNDSLDGMSHNARNKKIYSAMLAAAPQPAASVTDVAKDAARYKFLCRAAFDASMAQEEIDKEVDAAIAAQQGEKTK